MRRETFVGASALLILTWVQSPRAAQAFEGYQISNAAHFENLDVRFVRGVSSGGPSPVALKEAVGTGGTAVFAEGDGVYATNVSASPVFVEQGTLLKGGLQDQVVARSLILPPKSDRVLIDTFCVDPFRSSARRGEASNTFSVSGALFPWHVARVGMLTGTLEARAVTDLRELEVWWSIDTLRDRLSRRLGAPLEPPMRPYWMLSDDDRAIKQLAERRSGWTTSLPLVLESRRLAAAVRKYERILLPAAARGNNINGAVFTINGKIVGAEIYSSPLLFRKMWPDLLRAFAIEALASDQAGTFKPSSAEAAADFLRLAEVGPARTAVRYPVEHPSASPAINSAIGELWKADTLSPARVSEVLRALDAASSRHMIKLLLRESGDAIFAETSGTDGQWVNRSFLPRPAGATSVRTPEELIISAIGAGQVEGHAFDSFTADTRVIARPAQGSWTLMVEGARPMVTSPQVAAAPPPQSRVTAWLFAFAALLIATLLALIFAPRRRSGPKSDTATLAMPPAAAPELESSRDAVPGVMSLTALPEVSPKQDRRTSHLVAVTGVEQFEEAGRMPSRAERRPPDGSTEPGRRQDPRGRAWLAGYRPRH